MRFTAQGLRRGLPILAVVVATALLIYFVAVQKPPEAIFTNVVCDAYGYTFPDGVWVSPPPGWVPAGAGCYRSP